MSQADVFKIEGAPEDPNDILPIINSLIRKVLSNVAACHAEISPEAAFTKSTMHCQLFPASASETLISFVPSPCVHERQSLITIHKPNGRGHETFFRALSKAKARE